ncbi:MFS general substrate transporter [Setomelanomma holmii]|uniref:MFS general substrate transporter n=1 Tax=Setomelanomma holmii TaxID=210430 RepID=A0A9P4LIV5_9PLEO|nr:MFS general substrate transporter [Setomelanomma holmii]
MAQASAQEKVNIDPEQLAIVQDNIVQQRPTHYVSKDDVYKRLDKEVNLKFDFIVLALLSRQFIFCGIDKTNVGFVATTSLVKDAGLEPDDKPNSLSLFSATYVPLQLPMVVLARRVGVKYFLAFQLLTWGTLIVPRMLIGAAKAGFTQFGFFYMSTLYPKYDLALRYDIFAGMYSVAGAFAAVLAYGLLKSESSSLHGWQIVFIFEGGFTVFLELITFFLERAHAVRRMEIDLASTQEERDLIDVAKDWKKLFVVICNIPAVLPVPAFTTFLPLIVKGMGYKGITAMPMSVPPFVVGTVGLLIIISSSDHFKERSLHTVVGVCLGIIGCIVITTSTDTQLRCGFAHVCMVGIFVGSPLLAVWLPGNTLWKGKRSVMMGVHGWSHVAGGIAGQIFKSEYTPRYEVPLMITMMIMACGCCGLVFLNAMYRRENRAQARQVSNWDEADFAAEAASETRRGDQKRAFVYGY